MGKKGKEVAEQFDEGGDQSGSESDVPRPARMHRTKKPKKKPAQKKPMPRKATAESSNNSKPTPTSLLRKMKSMKFVQTKWADHTLLRELGIWDDVNAIFERIGLRGLFGMEYPAYESQTHQFLATLTFHDDTSLELSDKERAYITFKIDSKLYQVSMNDIEAFMGFSEDGEVCTLDLNILEAENVWRTIAEGEFSKGVSKAAKIRNPAIRYAHKFLASTLYARRENGNVKEDEFALLIEGIKPYLVTCSNGNSIIGQVDQLKLSHYLVNRFLAYKEWVHTTKDSHPCLSMGGLITPILEFCGVDFGANPSPIEHLDAHSLVKTRYLVGRLGTSYGYRFHTSETVQKKIVLPNISATTIRERENVIFKPRLFLLHDPTIHGAFIPIRPSKNTPTAEQEAQQEEEVFGAERYYFTPYDEPIRETALREAHHQNRKLMRWNKWQDKQIKKLVENLKGVKKTLRGLVKMVKGGSTSRREENREETAEETGESDAAGLEARHSYHGATSTAPLALAPARASLDIRQVYDRRPRGNKRKATRSPSTSGSGNRCYSMDTSSSNDH